MIVWNKALKITSKAKVLIIKVKEDMPDGKEILELC